MRRRSGKREEAHIMTTTIIYLKVILKSQSGNPRIKIDIPFGFFVDAGVL